MSYILYDKGVTKPEKFTTNKDSKLIELEDTAPLTFTKDMIITHYTTGEKGKVSFFIYHDPKRPEWTDETRDYIVTIINILTLAFARYHLIDSIRRNILYDDSTGIFNATGYMEFARELVEKRTIGNYNAYYFNLIRFRLVNRRFGKQETDRIIKKYAEKLHDLTEEDECVGRLGGDNFVALIKKSRTQIILDFIQGTELTGNLNGEQIPFTIKGIAGCYEIPGSLYDISMLIDRCAIAMNMAKKMPNCPYLFMTPEINSMVQKRHKVIASFPEAIENNDFVVYYQPKVDTFTQEIKGAEGLARWTKEEEIVPPSDFINVLEEDGSICVLDFYILNSVCRDIRKWLEQGLDPVRISVNFSRMNLANPNFAEDILKVIENHKIPKELIEIEITETLDETEKGLLQKFMNQLHLYGLITTIDDFGTGYSSINILREFPVNVLKLDKSFIANHVDRPKDRIVLANVVKMAKELNIEVVMEGVETMQQLNFAREIQCDMIQGFIFDKPMSERYFVERLKMRKYLTDDLKNEIS